MFQFLSTILSGQFLFTASLLVGALVFANLRGYFIIDEEFFALGAFSLFSLAAYAATGELMDSGLETKKDSIYEVFASLARGATAIDLFLVGVYLGFRVAGPKVPRLAKRYLGLKALALWKSMGLGLIQLVNQKPSRTEESLDDAREYADAYLSVKAFYRYFVRENVDPASRMPLHMFRLPTLESIVGAVRSTPFSFTEILGLGRLYTQYGQLQSH